MKSRKELDYWTIRRWEEPIDSEIFFEKWLVVKRKYRKLKMSTVCLSTVFPFLISHVMLIFFIHSTRVSGLDGVNATRIP